MQHIKLYPHKIVKMFLMMVCNFLRYVWRKHKLNKELLRANNDNVTLMTKDDKLFAISISWSVSVTLELFNIVLCMYYSVSYAQISNVFLFSISSGQMLSRWHTCVCVYHIILLGISFNWPFRHKSLIKNLYLDIHKPIDSLLWTLIS